MLFVQFNGDHVLESRIPLFPVKDTVQIFLFALGGLHQVSAHLLHNFESLAHQIRLYGLLVDPGSFSFDLISDAQIVRVFLVAPEIAGYQLLLLINGHWLLNAT